jgi:hypothetical protein
MNGRAAIIQVARLLGKEEFYRRLSLAEGAEPPILDEEHLATLRSLVDEQPEALVEGLAVEAVVNDDVVDAASAKVYLEDRLAFFGELLTEEQRRAVRKGFVRLTKRWG